MLRYPTLEDVEKADAIQLGRWYRFLPSPGLAHIGSQSFSENFRREDAVMERIIARLDAIGGMSADLSKAVGLAQP